MLSPIVPLEVDRRQRALTKQFLEPNLAALEAFFLEIRAQTDAALASTAPARRGKAYPYGYCMEITDDVMARLNTLSRRPDAPGGRALRAFIDKGGVGRKIWGVLRGRYFQNAMQFGSLYVDVSNDTVDVNKPKVEIMPMVDSGMELVRDGAHFAEIAKAYWDAEAYANTILPAIAPLFPVVLVGSDGLIEFQSNTPHMVSLFTRNGFKLAEQWLSEAPPAPDAVAVALRSYCPPDILDANPETGAAPALDLCRRLRAAGKIDPNWMRQTGMMFERVPQVRLAPAVA